ncbi:recombinase family protein [Oricola indica]|uniref:recombinase family protein n=1 Tax=Oricola indica TaxID=2872591 RepID=UPI001CBFAF81|nr:recombinase family protein [Oricola indica]
MGEIIGYARVSSVGQRHEGQVERLKEAGATKVFAEKVSGLDKERPELARCLEYLREGDTLLITKLDRLARSTSHLHQIVEDLTAKGVGFKVLDDASLDTTTRTGKLVFGILASIAEFETALRKERQMEGIAKAKAEAEKEGKPWGRPKLVTSEVEAKIAKLREDGMSIRKIAAEVGFSKATVQKAIS